MVEGGGYANLDGTLRNAMVMIRAIASLRIFSFRTFGIITISCYEW